MKKALKSIGEVRDYGKLLAGLTTKNVLSLEAMMKVRGGDADGNGSVPILVPPPPPIP